MGVAACRLPTALRTALWGRLPRRSARVAVLLGIILVLSLADLVLTLTYVMEIGLIEDNPIARLVLRTGGPWMLIAAKLASVGFTLGVLFWARKRGIAEVAAVVGTIVMIWVTLRWVGYIDASAQLSASLEDMEHHSQGAWVTMTEAQTD